MFTLYCVQFQGISKYPYVPHKLVPIKVSDRALLNLPVKVVGNGECSHCFKGFKVRWIKLRSQPWLNLLKKA